MNRKFLTDIKKLKEAIAANKLVVFAGAGISIDAGVPSWSTLIEEIKAEIDLPGNETDYLRIAQIYFNERQQKEFVEKVRSVLKHKKINHNEIHEAVLDLNPEHILTTNFDDLLEKAIEKKSLPFSIIKRDKDFPYVSTSNLLVKIHGDLDDVDIVLKEDDYLNYSLTHPLTESFIKSVFATKIVLFIGYSFSDVNLKIIMQSVKEILGKDFQNAYLLNTNKVFHNAQTEYLKYKSINVISYNEEFIIKYLSGNNHLFRTFNNAESLSTEEGQRLLNFLTFIKHYDHFNENISNLNLIDQMYQSLNRFGELKILPPNFVSNLFPFNISDEYVHNYRLGTLTTNNKLLYDLFAQQVEIENSNVKYNPPKELCIHGDEIAKFESKLKEIIRALNYSFIIAFDKEKSDSLGYKRSAGEKVKVFIPSNKSCDCLNCLWKNLKLAALINKIENTHIAATSKISNDLLLAYSYYQIGEFYKSYLLFDKIAVKAWKEGKYISYFIAKQNIKGLRNLLKTFDYKVFPGNKKDVIEKMDEINLDKLIIQIKSSNDLENQLLKDIRDDSNLKSAEKELERLLNKIVDTYEQYNSRNGYILPPGLSAKQINFELKKVIFFYTSNFIIADKFDDFQNFCNKALEGLVVLYAMSSEYPYRLESFDKTFLDTFIFYGNVDSIKRIFQRYKVESISFKKKDETNIIQLIINFFKSCYSTTFSNEVKPANLVNNFYFVYNLEKITTRIIFILSKIEFTADASHDFVKELKNFLTAENNLHIGNIEYLGVFIATNRHLFNPDDFEFLINLSFKKSKFIENSNFLGSLIYALHTQHPNYYIKENEFVVKTLLKKDAYNNIDRILILWHIFKKEDQIKVKNRILSELKSNFNTDLYLNASLKKIINYKDFYFEYINIVKELKTSTTDDPLTDYNNTNINLKYFQFIQFVNELNISKQLDEIQELKEKSKIIKAFLFPDEFDFELFELEWLTLVSRRQLYKELKDNKLLHNKILQSLREDYNERLAKVYFEYFT